MMLARTSVLRAATPPTMAIPTYPSVGIVGLCDEGSVALDRDTSVPLVTRVSMSDARLCAWRFEGSLSSRSAAHGITRAVGR